MLALMASGAVAGAFGALLGLGGGILIVPLLTIGFGLELREAVGASLVCVIVTSSAAASVYLQRGAANLRLGITLELFTALAAVGGGLIAFLVPDRMLGVMFAALLVYVSLSMARTRPRQGGGIEVDGQDEGHPAAGEDDAVPSAGGSASVPASPAPFRPAFVGPTFIGSLAGPGYAVANLRAGILGSLFAGVVSALFGVGGGIVKVPVMHVLMGVPLRVATATSNMMIGVTASAAGLVYLMRGGIDPYVAAPIAVGVFAGASVASRLAHRLDLRLLRRLFVVVLVATAAQMLWRNVS